ARVELTKRAPVQAPARLPSRSCRYALTKKQKIVLAVGVGLIGLALLAAYPVEYQSAVKQRSPPATSVVFINTLAGALERAESPSGLTCIVILAISFYRYRIPRNAGTIDEGYELLENAVQLEGQGRVQDALTAYEDIARRYSHTEAGRDAQKSMESLKSKIG
ncbi:MAG TPA: hypothetical protein VH619_15585, partial [Verrucomicrobiae bacterium]|nr:hypothetical protein [Verrucomicrobiae bacterium]